MKVYDIFLITRLSDIYDNEDNIQGFTEDPVYAFDSKEKLNEFKNSKDFNQSDYCIYKIVLNNIKCYPKEIDI